MMLVNRGLGIQVARLVAGHINILLGQEEGCCPQCCAPCAALAWLRDQADEPLSVWFEAWDTGWDWCAEDGHVRWAQVVACWTMTECHEE